MCLCVHPDIKTPYFCKKHRITVIPSRTNVHLRPRVTIHSLRICFVNDWEPHRLFPIWFISISVPSITSLSALRDRLPYALSVNKTTKLEFPSPTDQPICHHRSQMTIYPNLCAVSVYASHKWFWEGKCFYFRYLNTIPIQQRMRSRLCSARYSPTSPHLAANAGLVALSL